MPSLTHLLSRRRHLILLIFCLLELFGFGCALTRPFLPAASTPTPAPPTLTPDYNAKPYAGDIQATGQVMKATVFAQARATPSLFRDRPDLWSLSQAIPGIPLILLGAGAMLHYQRVRRKRWAAGVSFRGFIARVGVARGKQAVRGARVELWYGWIYLSLGIIMVVLGILLAFIQ